MNLLESNYGVSFNYGGKPFTESLLSKQEQAEGDAVRTVFILQGGLKVTQIKTKKGTDAVEWINWFENVSDADTAVISELYDLSAELPLKHEDKLQNSACMPSPEGLTRVFVPVGSNLCESEFSPERPQAGTFDPPGVLLPSKERVYASHGGRSSCGNAPFFNIHKEGEGYFIAVGWTGQWRASLKRDSDDLIFRAGVEDARFYLKPGERFRTSSVLVMPYRASLDESYNLFRRLLREHYSIVGQPGRAEKPPVCLSLWGGMSTDDMLERLRLADEYRLPADTVWIDAGWYGSSDKPSPDEFEGDWALHTGEWQVNPHLHPDGMKKVSEAVHAGGRKLLLWFEPERARKNTPNVGMHPEYFYKSADPQDSDLLLNLGSEAARKYCFDMLCGHIDALGIDWYRQDFNMVPLKIWRHNDEPDRFGISEIKHINGMYALWDALLEKYPALMIDNCSSGGKRIDIETLKRSVPLWRSDMQCPANFSAEMSQAHAAQFGLWLPYSGTGTGRPCEKYRCRSAYAPALNFGEIYSAKESLTNIEERLKRLHSYLAEYGALQEYFSEDIYVLLRPCPGGEAWNALQYHRQSDGSGVILVFRGRSAPYKSAHIRLRGMQREKDYLLSDADGQSGRVLAGAALLDEGLEISLPEEGSSVLIRYTEKRRAVSLDVLK